MGTFRLNQAAKERKRTTFNVPSKAGDYASEQITLGSVPSGEAEQSYTGVTVLIEGSEPMGGAFVELWLPRVADSGKAASALDLQADYSDSGQVLLPVGTSLASPTGKTTSFGSLTYPLAGYPGAQLRVKSAGSQGQVTVSVTGF